MVFLVDFSAATYSKWHTIHLIIHRSLFPVLPALDKYHKPYALSNRSRRRYPRHNKTYMPVPLPQPQPSSTVGDSQPKQLSSGLGLDSDDDSNDNDEKTKEPPATGEETSIDQNKGEQEQCEDDENMKSEIKAFAVIFYAGQCLSAQA